MAEKALGGRTMADGVKGVEAAMTVDSTDKI